MLPTESITLVTGLPGAGKSLYSVHLAKQFAAEGVRVFAWGLDGASPDLFEVLPDKWSFADWQTLPSGSVVFFDEAHKILPVRVSGAPPKSISDLTEIRHFGLRFVFLTQDPRNLDVFVRRLVGRHFHLTRKMGFPGSIVRSFDKCADDPTDYHAVKTATSELWKYPKDLFKLYKSASLHVVKPKIPKKVIIFGSIGLAGFLFAMYVLFTYSMKVKDGDIIPSGDSSTSENPYMPSEASVSFSTLDEYIEAITPLSPVAPWTAPIYEGVRTVKSLPSKPLCIIGRRGCRCFTEQVTPIPLPDVVCRDIVENGVYSPYHLPYEQVTGQVQGGGQANSRTPPAISSGL